MSVQGKSAHTGLVQLLDERKAAMAILLIFTVAILVRVAGFIIVPNANISTNAEKGIIGGASLILEGKFLNNVDYPLQVPPLPAVFTAAVQKVFGSTLVPVKLIQQILDSLCVVVVFLIGRRFLPYKSAVLGGLLVAVYPFTAFASLYIGTETLFTMFLALFILYSVKALEEDRRVDFTIAGIFLGLATLSRGTTLYFPVIFLVILYWYNRPAKSLFLQYTFLFLAGFLLIVGPWTARNYILLHEVIPSSTAGAPIFNGSSEEFWEIEDRQREYPKYAEYLKEQFGVVPPSETLPPGKHWWVEKDRYQKFAAFEKYRQRWVERPLSYVPFLLEKFARMWYATEQGHRHVLIFLLNFPFYVFGLYGLYLLLRSHNRIAIYLGVLFSYFIAVHVAVYSLFRYTLPIMPYVILLTAYSVVTIWQRIQKKASDRTGTS